MCVCMDAYMCTDVFKLQLKASADIKLYITLAKHAISVGEVTICIRGHALHAMCARVLCVGGGHYLRGWHGNK